MHEMLGVVVNVVEDGLGLFPTDSLGFFDLPVLEEGEPAVTDLFRPRTGEKSPVFSITVFAWFPLEPLSLKVTPTNF